MSKKAETAPTPPAGITPDEVILLRRRQEWRGRMLQICLNVLNGLRPEQLPALAVADHRDLWQRFRRLAEPMERDMKRLLESEMVLPELEMHRHGANYFLDTLILMLRQQEEERARRAGHQRTEGPLESLPADVVEREVRRALDQAPDTIAVFLSDLLEIEQFELEVQQQRRRLQCLLGCDRALRDLAGSNAEIIEASPEELVEIVDRFFALCRGLEHELRPLLEQPSPYPRLQRELDTSREQLGWMVENVFQPMAGLRGQVQRLQEQLVEVRHALARLQARAVQLRRLRPDAAQSTISLREVLELKTRLVSLQAELEAINATSLRSLCGGGRGDLAALERRLSEQLGPLEEKLIQLETELVGPGLEMVRLAESGDEAVSTGGFRRLLGELGDSLEALERQHLLGVLALLDELADRNLMLLKERICQELGFVRTTFLQPSFAHIAAGDPRSTHPAQYFYLKEFAEEALRSQQLLEAAQAVWLELERAQSTSIEGLRFTANNLKKIADRVLHQRHSVPSGPGWSELANFLTVLKDRLVPRLRMICQQPGVRFDDKDQLSRFAGDISENCSMLLAQRETALKLVKEIQEHQGDEDDRGLHQRYESKILAVTCEDMAVKLRDISTTLVELIPFVGAMVGNIRMRTSLTFQQQQRERQRRDLG